MGSMVPITHYTDSGSTLGAHELPCSVAPNKHDKANPYPLSAKKHFFFRTRGKEAVIQFLQKVGRRVLGRGYVSYSLNF